MLRSTFSLFLFLCFSFSLFLFFSSIQSTIFVWKAKRKGTSSPHVPSKKRIHAVNFPEWHAFQCLEGRAKQRGTNLVGTKPHGIIHARGRESQKYAIFGAGPFEDGSLAATLVVALVVTLVVALSVPTLVCCVPSGSSWPQSIRSACHALA